MNTSTPRFKSQTTIKNRLAQENHKYIDTGGISENNRSQGFVPAFLDSNTGNIYRSRFANGMPAPIHMLSGLPQTIKNSVVSGFLLEKIFYTREEAAAALKSVH